MKKKIFTMFLILVLVFNAYSLGAIAATDDEIYSGNQLRTLGILKGYSDGSLKLDNNISRAEVATLAVRILGYEDTIILGQGKDFFDVDHAYWAFNNIQNAYKLGIIKGYPGGDFRPLNNITYQEVIAIMVNALGESNNLEGDWPHNYLNKAKALGVIPSNSNVEPTKVVTRGEMAVIVWDTLLVIR